MSATQEHASTILRNTVVQLLELMKDEVQSGDPQATNGFDLMNVIADVRSLQNRIDGGSSSRTPIARVPRPVQEMGMFRFEVRDEHLVRIGKRENGKGEYEQFVDRERFDEVMRAIQTVLARVGARGRVQATEVQKEAGTGIPYYQINLVTSFVNSTGLAKKCAERPESLTTEGNALWEAFQR